MYSGEAARRRRMPPASHRPILLLVLRLTYGRRPARGSARIDAWSSSWLDRDGWRRDTFERRSGRCSCSDETLRWRLLREM